MVRILRLSLLYFGLVFGAGFLLGVVRVLLLEPRFGTRVSELLEMPVMLLVIWVAAGWLTRRFKPLSTAEWLSIGILAVLEVLAADVAVGVFLRGMTLVEVFLRRDVVSSVAYYGLLVLCGLMPWLQGRRTKSITD
jgi:hypothetical protein